MPKLKEVRMSQGTAAGRRRPGRLLTRVLIMSLLLLLPAACAVPPGALTVPMAKVQPTALPVPAGILGGEVQPTTFAQVKEAIDRLYSRHPDVDSFNVKGVTYNPETRDKVLKICHEGGLVSSEAEREAQEVLACAPLIFFFYSYGQASGVPDSTEVARLMYWYTVTSHSTQSKEVLTKLLSGWGIK